MSENNLKQSKVNAEDKYIFHSSSLLKCVSKSSLSVDNIDDTFTEQIIIPNDRFKNEYEVLLSKNYRNIKEVGHGGYGIVYKTEKITDKSILACKVINLNKKTFERMIRHFKTELYVMMKCRHPNIINVVDHFIINTKAYILMEFAEGGTLTQYAKKSIGEIMSKKYFYQIIRGLIHLHENYIAHRDLKLDNILLVYSGSNQIVKITDFGLSVAAYNPRKGYIEPGTFAGTRLYMAPEIIRIRVYKEFRKDVCFEFDPFKSDIWALGVCLFELITSKMPFNTNNDAELLRMQESCQYKFLNACKLSEFCKDILVQMLNPDPRTRIDPFGILTHPWVNQSIQDTIVNKT